MPQYLLTQSDDRVVVRNFEGLISTYAQPRSYQGHDPATCKYCQQMSSEGGQEGIGALLRGDKATLVPEGYEEAHRRSQTNSLEAWLSEAESLGVVQGGF